MNNTELDDFIYKMLRADEEPSMELNDSVKRRYRTLQEVKRMKQRKKKYLVRIAAACLIAAVFIPASVYAAKYFLSAKQATKAIGDNKLAEQFDEKMKDSGAITMDLTDSYGNYQVNVLGTVSGKNISDFISETDGISDMDTSKTYIVTAISKIDGMPMTYDDDVLITPFIQGIEPWKFNIYYLNGEANSIIVDGVLYRMIACGDLEIFADREIYLGAMSGMDFRNAYAYAPDTGKITKNDAYEGMNLLFTIPFSASKADATKAAAFLEELNQGSSETENNESEEIGENGNPIEWYLTEKEILDNCKMIEGTKKLATLNTQTNQYEYVGEDGDYWATGDEELPDFKTNTAVEGYYSLGATLDENGKAVYLLLHKEVDGTVTGAKYQ